MDKSNRRKSKPKIKIYNKKPKHSEEDEIQQLQDAYQNINPDSIDRFEDLPLSNKLQKGLKEYNYMNPTEIQKSSIIYSLKGEDILGAAKTGSGKTLAFLIPLLEVLYCKKWTNLDGLGGLVITPTRELAYQIFETMKKIGKYYDFSAGLIIGGKDLKFERKRMDQCNIVICTPGRLLQHMDENPLFDCNNLQILVLDEADRCLDMGFEHTMNSIIENLPLKRQTLLFSATQTKSVKDLARLSLKDARYVSVHEDAKYSTPAGLTQSYIVCQLHDKINFLWSFLKNHRKQKILVFMSSCKQVKYIYEALCRLKPGISLMALYGTLHQQRRMTIYDSFCQKQNIVLFATDIAARGLDFPEVNWVVQLDCPESATEYIHRAGRTARYQKSGESLLILLPSELAILEHLKAKRIPIEEIQVSQHKMHTIQRNLEALLARDVNLKASAQRAFVSYIKSVFLMKDKEVFNVASLNTDLYARSLGLAIPPRIRFLQNWQKRQNNKNDVKQENNVTEKSENNDDEPELSKKNDLARIYDFYNDNDNTDDENADDFLQLKRKDHDLDEMRMNDQEPLQIQSKSKNKIITKAAVVKKMMKKKIKPNKKIIFDDEGQPIMDMKKEFGSEMARQYAMTDEPGIDIETAQRVLREEDIFDKQLFQQRVKQKHQQAKKKFKQVQKPLDDEEDVIDDFGESDEDDDSLPDLSWLPDPIPDNNDSIETENNRSLESEEEDFSNIPLPKKRCAKSSNLQYIKTKRKKQDDLELLNNSDFDLPAATDDSLLQDEQLVLQLIAMK